MNDKYNKVYKIAIDQARHQETLLFDRENYFLAGSAFLVTAYAALAVSVNVWSHSHSILWLTYIVNGTGFYLSIFFAIINYLNTRIIGAIFLAIKIMERGSETDDDLNAGNYFSYDNHMAKTVIKEDFHDNSFLLIIGPLKGAIRFLTNPFQQGSKDKEAPHTYLIPLSIAIFWLIVLFLIFPPNWFQATLYFLPLVLVLNTLFLNWLKNIKLNWLKVKWSYLFIFLDILSWLGAGLIIFLFTHSKAYGVFGAIALISICWVVYLVIKEHIKPKQKNNDAMWHYHQT